MAGSSRTGRRLYEALDSFVVRAPLLPVPERPAVVDGALVDPRVRLAVAVAAPDLAAALARTPSGSPSGSRDDAALRRALLRYRIRMATRPTPFGLFAGAALGSWAPTTDLALAGGPRPVSARPDMGWLMGLVRRLEQRPDVRRGLALVANTCALSSDGRVYLDDPGTGGASSVADVSVRATPAVRAALDLARRPVAYRDLAAALLARPGASEERVHGLLDELWRLGLLGTELTPPLTRDPVRHVADRLAGVPAAAAEAAELTAVTGAAARLERAASAATAAEPVDGAVDAAAGVLTAARARARALYADGDAEVVQVDSGLALAGATLSSRVAAEAARAVELLLRLHPAPGGPAHLAGYRAAFLARYGPERLVPVLELLDPRFGLGPPSGHAHAGWPPGGRAARRHDALLELAAGALRDGAAEVELGDDHLDALTTWRPEAASVPPSVELSAFVAARSPAAVDRGDFRLVVGPNLGAQAAGRGLGRFAGLLGPPATELLGSVARAEQAQRPHAVHAELVYLPEPARLANVVVRPAVRGHEVAVGVAAGVADHAVVPVDELAVGVPDGRLRLWWPSRGTEVVVCTGHMLNTRTAPEVCRFLSEVALDGVTTLTDFDWGPAASLPYLPQVRCGRVVLRTAEWRQPRAAAASALHADDERRFRSALRRWRETWRVPRHVYLAAGDNRLLLDLDEPAQAELLREEARRDRGWYLLLEEALPGPDDAWVPGPGGRYATEVVVPLVRRASPSAAPAAPAAPPPPAVSPEVIAHGDPRRRRPPGSDWLYLTLSGPRATEDEVLAGPVRGLVERLATGGRIDSWHFLRYADPEPHLRLRVHGHPATLLDAVLPSTTTWAANLVARGLRSRFGVEVYERELERYGGAEGTSVAEALFAADSAATADLLAVLAAGDAAPVDLVDVAVLSADDLLASLGLDPQQRLAWYGEAGIPARESGAAYRARKERLRALLAGDSTVLGASGPAVRATLGARGAAVSPLAARLETLARDGTLPVAFPVLARSYLHLHANRLLGVDGSRERLVLGLARRTVASLAAAPLPGPEPGSARGG